MAHVDRAGAEEIPHRQLVRSGVTSRDNGHVVITWNAQHVLRLLNRPREHVLANLGAVGASKLGPGPEHRPQIFQNGACYTITGSPTHQRTRAVNQCQPHVPGTTDTSTTLANNQPQYHRESRMVLVHNHASLPSQLPKRSHTRNQCTHPAMRAADHPGRFFVGPEPKLGLNGFLRPLAAVEKQRRNMMLMIMCG